MQRTTAYLLVAAQFGLSAAIVFGSQFMPPCIVCLAVAGSGAAVAIWAWIVMGIRRLNILPQVKLGAELVRTGPYRLIRHPMYSGLLLFCAGLLATHYTPGRMALWLLLVAVLVVKSRLEERLLAERFAAYAEYCRKTWRFLPFVY